MHVQCRLSVEKHHLQWEERLSRQPIPVNRFHYFSCITMAKCRIQHRGKAKHKGSRDFLSSIRGRRDSMWGFFTPILYKDLLACPFKFLSFVNLPYWPANSLLYNAACMPLLHQSRTVLKGTTEAVSPFIRDYCSCTKHS